MHPKRIAILIVTFSFLTAASACKDESKDAGSKDGAAGDPVPTEQVAVSRQARVKYKSGARYANDLAEALDLSRDAVCRELGRYDCVDEVHRIVLGGVEPYTLGVRSRFHRCRTAPSPDRSNWPPHERIERDCSSEPFFLDEGRRRAATPGSSAHARRLYRKLVVIRRPTSQPLRNFIRGCR